MKTDDRICTFGARVSEFRREKNLTQARLARSAGVTVETIARIERTIRGGRSSANMNPTLGTIIKIADALGVSVCEFFTASPAKHEDSRARKLRLEALSRVAHDLEVLRRLA